VSEADAARTTLVVPAEICSEEFCRALRKTLAAHPGPMPLAVRLEVRGSSRILRLPYWTSRAGVERLARMVRVVIDE